MNNKSDTNMRTRSKVEQATMITMRRSKHRRAHHAREGGKELLRVAQNGVDAERGQHLRETAITGRRRGGGVGGAVGVGGGVGVGEVGVGEEE